MLIKIDLFENLLDAIQAPAERQPNVILVTIERQPNIIRVPTERYSGVG